MRIRIILTTIFLLSTFTLTHAQSKEILAKSAMLNAEEAYNNENYSECFSYLKEAETTLGKTNSSIQYLKVKALMATSDWKRAEAELKVYFEVTPESEAVPEKYDEMVLAVSKIKRSLAEEAKIMAAEEAKYIEAQQVKERDEKLYNLAKTQNTINAYQQYIKSVPNGKYVSEAKGKIKVIFLNSWMTKNLDVDRYRNGDLIPEVKSKNQWSELTTGAWCYYDNKAANGVIYGRLYNWYAVNDPRGLCPTGWHVPTDTEWSTLTAYLGGEEVAGGILKESGTSHWKSPNTGATNEIGFTALPGGYRISSGTFILLSYLGGWWSATEGDATDAWDRGLNDGNGGIYRDGSSKEVGYSVRCLRDY